MIKRRETRAVIYTCRYSRGQFNGVDDCPCFSTFSIMTLIPIDCKITNFSLYFIVYLFLVTIIIFGELTSATSKERMTTNIIFVGATPIN